MKTAIAIRHVHFEDLGTLAPLLQRRGYQTHYYDVGVQDLNALEVDKVDLLVVLGAPIGACDEQSYPFLTQELRLIEHRLNLRTPSLGICLGAQLMARALGAAVAPMGHTEIGFSPVALTAAGNASPLAKLSEHTSVLHWHGDQFSIPNGFESLANTPLCPHQAFALGNYALGLQFHLEANVDRIDTWLVGHAAELSQAGIDPCSLRAQAKEHGPGLKTAAEAVFGAWLDQVAL